MRKMVFMFPGVGSQYVGMGKVFHDNFKIVRDTFEEAGDVLNADIAGLCFTPEKKKYLARLENSQTALLTLSTATFRVYMEEVGIEPRFCMGHSLGEYSALCCAGVIRFPDVLELVRQRGLIVNEVSASITGTMAWVINLDNKIVEDICGEHSTDEEMVVISAYDSSHQTSISGHTPALLTAAKELEKAGAIVYPLKFSGPFHSPLMKPAAEQMGALLKKYEYRAPRYPVIANRNARPYEGEESVIENLTQQLISPIRWKASTEYLEEQGVEIAVEVGPKDVLKFLMKKNSRTIRTYTLDNPNDLQRVKEELLVTEEDYLPVIGKCLGLAVGTKNRNHNDEEYQKHVVEPFERVQNLYNGLKASGGQPTRDQVIEAVEMLRHVLAVKKVPPRERQWGLNRLFGDKLLSFR